MGALSPLYPQPTGGTLSFQWTFDGVVLTWKNAATLLDSSSIRVGATSESAAGALRVRLRYVYTTATTSYIVDDDSAETPPPGTDAPNADYYKFTAHKPQSVDIYSSTAPGQPYSEPNKPYGWIVVDVMKLSDHLDSKMPGVYVQERWPSHPPITVNPYGQAWQTLRSPDIGVFNVPDYLRCASSFPMTYAGQNPPIIDATQQYWGGTRSTIGGGVFTSAYNVKMWTDRIEHIKSN